MNLWLLIAKFGFLVILYAFVIWVFVVILREKARTNETVGPRFVVQLVSGPSSPKAFELRGIVAIGRSRENEIWLSDNTVSNHHARISMADGFWMIEDLGSKNGTLVNGERIDSCQRIFPEDKISIGRNQLIVINK